MKKYLFTGVLISLMASCSTSTDQVSNTKKNTPTQTVEEENLVAIIPNRKLTTDIDGMTCVMGCGSIIREELLNTGAVSRCSFDFKGMNETSIAMVEFDKDKISTDEIADLIKKLNDGQFSLGKMSTEPIALEMDESKTDDVASSKKEEINPITVSSSSGIQLPNFIDLISELLIH